MPPIPGDTEAVSSTTSEENATDGLNQDNANPDAGAAAEESSNSADGKETVSEKDWDPLSVVKKAIGKDQDESGAAEGEGGEQTDGSSKSGKGDQKAEGGEELPAEVTAEELKGYKPATRKRIEGLLDDRSRLTDRVKELEPAAEQMEALHNYMQERNLTPQNVSELLLVGGLVMSDNPKDLQAALVRVDSFRDQILSQLGEKLPDDLQKKVDDGLLDADSAKEVALSRVNAQRAEQRVLTAKAHVENAGKVVEDVNTTQAKERVHSTITDWQSQKFKSDPDYSRKAELLTKEIRLRVASEPNGVVLDPKRALTIAEEAYKEVNRIFGALAPSNTNGSKRVLTSKANQQQMASVPNTALDAARAGLAKAHK